MSKLHFLVATALAAASLGAQADVTMLTDPSQMTPSFVDTFEEGMNVGPFTFFGSVVVLAADFVGGETPSKTHGLAEIPAMQMLVSLSSGYTEIGMYFGGSQLTYGFGVYSGADLVGSVSLAANGNVFADQFLGLASTVPFDHVRMYGGTNYIDDIGVGAPVPEPQTCALMLAGLAMLGLAARRRKA